MKFQVRAARNLLSAVARLLILADMIDVHMLLMKLQRVEDDLEVLKSASSQAELIEGMERFGDSAHELMTQVSLFRLKTAKKIMFCFKIETFDLSIAVVSQSSDRRS